MNAARLYTSDKERDTRLLGTKGYAAPEQFGFGNSTCQTDIYAVGALLKSLITNENSDIQISKFLQAIINKCLALTPANRYQSAQQLKDTLLKLQL